MKCKKMENAHAKLLYCSLYILFADVLSNSQLTAQEIVIHEVFNVETGRWASKNVCTWL